MTVWFEYCCMFDVMLNRYNNYTHKAFRIINKLMIDKCLNCNCLLNKMNKWMDGYKWMQDVFPTLFDEQYLFGTIIVISLADVLFFFMTIEM